MISFKHNEEHIELPKKLNVASSRFEETIPNEDFHFYRLYILDEPEAPLLEIEEPPTPISQELIEEDYSDKIIVIDSSPKQTLPIDNFAQMMEAPDFEHASFLDIKLWALLHSHFRMGIDYEDLITMRNRDLDFDNDTLVIHPKSGINVSFSIHSHLKDCLLHYVERRKGKPDDFLFCNEQGQELSLMACHFQIHKILSSYKLSDISQTELNKFYRQLF